jgi:hypothetical protein
MTFDMFATLARVTHLVDEGNPDEAYHVMKTAVMEDNHGFARIFLSEWMKHMEIEEESIQNKFAEILIFLKEDFPEAVPLPEHEPEPEPLEPTVDAIATAPPPPPSEPNPAMSKPAAKEHLTLTFYDWQMIAISKAATKEKVDENALLSRMLETQDFQPLTWARYRQGKASPHNRITISVPCQTKKSLTKSQEAEGVTTTTKYVRKVLFGERAEKY